MICDHHKKGVFKWKLFVKDIVKFKADVALEAFKADKTMNEIGAHFKVHRGQVSQSKKSLLKGIPGVFGSKQAQEELSEPPRIHLYEEIDRVKCQ